MKIKDIEIEMEMLAKRLLVAREEQRAIDMAALGYNCYEPWTLDKCREELGLKKTNLAH